MILLLGFKHVVPLRYHYRKNYFIIIFFYKKILQVQKTPKAPKAQKAPKAKRRNQVKAQNANKRISDFSPLVDVFYAYKTQPFLILFAYLRFCTFCGREEKKIRKKRKVPTM